jgi:hypothetical protein
LYDGDISAIYAKDILSTEMNMGMDRLKLIEEENISVNRYYG